MSTQSHTCTKPGCFYCYELNRIRKTIEPTPEQTAMMIQAAIEQLQHIITIPVMKNRYSDETDKYIAENMHISSDIIGKDIGRTASAVAMRKVYLRRNL